MSLPAAALDNREMSIAQRRSASLAHDLATAMHHFLTNRGNASEASVQSILKLYKRPRKHTAAGSGGDGTLSSFGAIAHSLAQHGMPETVPACLSKHNAAGGADGEVQPATAAASENDSQDDDSVATGAFIAPRGGDKATGPKTERRLLSSDLTALDPDAVIWSYEHETAYRRHLAAEAAGKSF